MDLPDHPHRQRTAALEDLGRSAFAAEHGGEVLLAEVVLFHVDFDGLDGIALSVSRTTDDFEDPLTNGWCDARRPAGGVPTTVATAAI